MQSSFRRISSSVTRLIVAIYLRGSNITGRLSPGFSSNLSKPEHDYARSFGGGCFKFSKSVAEKRKGSTT
jgi:hypothetical protein